MDLIENSMDTIFSTFGEKEPILLLRDGEEDYPMRGIFSEVSQDVTNGGVVITSSAPNVTIWENELPTTLETSFRFHIRGENYSIKDYYRDGYGNINLELFRE